MTTPVPLSHATPPRPTSPGDGLPSTFPPCDRGPDEVRADGDAPAPPPPDTRRTPRAFKPPACPPGDCLVVFASRTSGPVPERDELLEIGLVHACARTFRPIDEISVRIAPASNASAAPHAPEAPGHRPPDVEDAYPLDEALTGLAPWLEHATLAGHNIFGQFLFLKNAYETTGVPGTRTAWRLVDTGSLGWPYYAQGFVPAPTLHALADCLHAPPPMTHSALGLARTACAVAAAMVRQSGAATLTSLIPPHERATAELLLVRLATGPMKPRPGQRLDPLVKSMEKFLRATRALAAKVERVPVDQVRQEPWAHRVPSTLRRF